MAKKIVMFLVVIFIAVGCFDLFAVERIDSGAEISMAYEMDGNYSAVKSPVKSMAKNIIGAALAVSLIIVIYHVANDGKYGKGKQAVISWVIAVVIYIISINIM